LGDADGHRRIGEGERRREVAVKGGTNPYDLFESFWVSFCRTQGRSTFIVHIFYVTWVFLPFYAFSHIHTSINYFNEG